MRSTNQEPYRTVNLFDWTGGVRDKRQNPLMYPENALMSGENVDLVDGGMKTRRGCSAALVSPLRTSGPGTPGPVASLATDPTGADYPVYGHSAVYEPNVHAMLVFGGLVGGEPSDDLRIYDIATDTWEIVWPCWPPSEGPPPRAYHSAVYDRMNRTMWVFGGYDGSSTLNDLWKYDVATNTWEAVSPSGTVAAPRQRHSAIFDPVGRCMYVFGGMAGDDSLFHDLWKYDVENNEGTLLSSGGPWPEARFGHTAVYDSDRRTMLVFGGHLYDPMFVLGDEAVVADLWKYDILENAWTRIRSPDGGTEPHPERVYHHVAVYFDALHSMIINGGLNRHMPNAGGPGEDKIWTYNVAEDSFSETTLSGEGISNNPLFNHSAVYDELCRGVIFLGGVGTNELWGFGYGGPCSYTNQGDLPEPAGRFTALAQVRFPTNQSSYLLAQIEHENLNSLHGSAERLPVSGSPPSFQELYNLGSNAGPCSVAVLNDRAVITDGLNRPPLVFAGCMDPSGSDWAVPKAALITYDGGSSWHDITNQVCDKDPDTFGDLSSLSGSGGQLLVCTDMSGVSGFHFEMQSPNNRLGGMTVQGYSGEWAAGGGWLDHTSGLLTDGTVIHQGGVFSADYHVVNNVPGYWFSFAWPSGTGPGTLVRRILFQAPCQNLQVIGEGQPDTPLGFIYWDNSENSAKDFTVEVSDSTYPSFARLNDGQLESPVGMGSGDALFVGYLTPFNGVDLTPHNDYHNEVASIVSGYYWNGLAWISLPGFADRTQKPAGTTLGVKGRLSWTTPAAWRQCRPIGPEYPHGYWVKLVVSASLTPKTYISEASIWPVLEPLKKHKFALTVRDRMVLLNRPDASDQADISRAYEEYGFAGIDSASQRIGGQDAIVAAHTVFNQGFIAKTEDWYLFNGYSPETFSFERAEAAGQAPLNNQVVVKAPLTEADDKNLMGLYYINRTGAWYFAGIKVYKISEEVSWWDDTNSLPRLDLAHLHEACGVYWPERNWVIWAVPMITTGFGQETNNRLIIYDLTLRTWLPPFTISLASLTTAYHYNENAPGKLGQLGLYGGDYSGRVLRLFGPNDATDLGVPITAWAETGWLHFGSPQWYKIVRRLQLYGRTVAGESITVKIWADGKTDASNPVAGICLSSLEGLPNQLFGLEEENVNTQGRFFKFRFEFSDVTDVFGLQLGVSLIREWGAS
ncbi:MAG: hypothetical protein HY913_18910 [Desulfomonile tiedjei]|nr:hypothetical protein [Desulfomonile tiedjei]